MDINIQRNECGDTVADYGYHPKDIDQIFSSYEHHKKDNNEKFKAKL